MDLEDDGTLLLETLQSQFGATAIGLCYSFQEGRRSVRVKNGACLAPKTGWGSITYEVVDSSEASVEETFTPTVPLKAEPVLMCQSTNRESPRSQSIAGVCSSDELEEPEVKTEGKGAVL